MSHGSGKTICPEPSAQQLEGIISCGLFMRFSYVDERIPVSCMENVREKGRLSA